MERTGPRGPQNLTKVIYVARGLLYWIPATAFVGRYSPSGRARWVKWMSSADYDGPRADIWAVYPSRRHLSAKVRLFVDHLAAAFAAPVAALAPHGPRKERSAPSARGGVRRTPPSERRRRT